MRSDLYRELVASLQGLFGRLAHAYSGGRAGNDDCSCWQSRALGEKADEFGDAKDEVTVDAVRYRMYCLASGNEAYSSGQSCRTLPFFEPRM